MNVVPLVEELALPLSIESAIGINSPIYQDKNFARVAILNRQG